MTKGKIEQFYNQAHTNWFGNCGSEAVLELLRHTKNLEASLKYWQDYASAAWDKGEERRKENEQLKAINEEMLKFVEYSASLEGSPWFYSKRKEILAKARLK